jgi:hypothetical protein
MKSLWNRAATRADRISQGIGWLIAAGLVLAFITPVFRHFQVKWELSAYRKKLVAAGEKLDIPELAPRVTSASTNAGKVLRLMRAMPNLVNEFPNAMKFVEPGVSRVAWRETTLLQRLDYSNKPEVDMWPELRAIQKTNDLDVRELIVFLNNNAVQIVCDYPTQDGGVSFLSPVKTAAIDLAAMSLLNLHDGNSTAAFDALRACGGAMHLLSDNPLMISQIVRFGEQNFTLGVLW